MSQRPSRIRIHDSLGRLRSLAEGPEAYDFLNMAEFHAKERASALVLGLGPCPARLDGFIRKNIPEKAPVYWIECPDFLAALEQAAATPQIPEQWIRLDLRSGLQPLIRLLEEQSPALFAYRQARRLFPEFWGPLLAACRLGGTRRERTDKPRPHGRRTVLLPGSSHDLLYQELRQAFEQEGVTPLPLPGAEGSSLPDPDALAALLQEETPEALVSVNIHGLDPEGNVFHLLRAAGVPVCIWFVDNPWQILSSLRLPWWKDALVLTSDASFLPGLRACGAQRAEFMPLAASSFFLSPPAAPLPEHVRVLFVGRSRFPDRDAFYAAARRHPLPAERARELLRRGERPDFHWWKQRIDEIRGRSAPLWPGNEMREYGRGAEELALENRLMWLREAARLGSGEHPALALVGDEDWKKLLCAPALFLPPVDYYGSLPGLYRAAPFTLDVTSLLLPGGLTQRHFDVWRAGGFLLTATGEGMNIFPAELSEAVLLRRPGDLLHKVKMLENDEALRESLRSSWQKEIARKHLYTHRVRAILELAKKLDGASLQV